MFLAGTEKKKILMGSDKKNKKPQFRLSLRSRVALVVALPIFIVLVSISFINYSREFKLLDEQARLDAIQLGDLMIHSLNHAMLTKEDEHLLTSLDDVSQLENIQLIQVIGISGKVLADSGKENSKKMFSPGDAECISCHQFSVENRPRVIPFAQPENGWRISAPINNLPQCYDCHDPELDHLGVLLVDIALTRKQEQLQIDLQNSLLISVAGTVMVSMMSYFLMNRLVVRRVESLRESLAEYANGNFSTRIMLASSIQDELCDLADTFNVMAEELDRHAQREERHQQLREFAIVEERERIARELHDGFAQVLGYVNTKVMAVRLFVKDNKLKEADQQLEHLEEAARSLFVDVREAILGLRMAGQVRSGLGDALDDYFKEFSRLSGISTTMKTTLDLNNGMLTAETELHLFRIVQESLTNVRKHALASQAWVNVSQRGEKLHVEICDDGAGFDLNLISSTGTDKLGLSNMRDRAGEIGAEFFIDSKEGKGTRIVIEFPLDKGEI